MYVAGTNSHIIIVASVLFTWLCFFKVRCRRTDPSLATDLLLQIAIETLIFWKWLVEIQPSIKIALGLHYLSLLLALLTRNLNVGFLRSQEPRTEQKLGQDNSNASLNPLIFPCRTVHSRREPRKHSFSYSYLLVGVPVPWQGRINRILSAGAPAEHSLFHVDSADHLARDDVQNTTQPLQAKLKRFLESQGAKPDQYPFVYLITAPRVLGYNFNPVSFWYLYSPYRELKAMILEVNNTFDERRMYLLNDVKSSSEKIPAPRDRTTGFTPKTQIDSSGSDFASKWQKDFHVSPFNSRKGSYTLRAADIHPFDNSSMSIVSNKITLITSDGRPKLNAQIFSTGEPLDPHNLTTRQTVILILKWGWVGFVTFPRIVREAWKLYFYRNLSVWYRPEVADGSIPRRSTATEEKLENFFIRWLGDCVQKTTHPVRVIYTSATSTQANRVLDSPSFNTARDKQEILHIRVVAPTFYPRFMHYSHVLEGFERESLGAGPLSRTVILVNPQILPKIFAKPSPDSLNRSTIRRLDHFDEFRWNLLQRLRCAPPDHNYGHRSRGAEIAAVKDIRSLPLSPVDLFVLQNDRSAAAYRRLLCLQFIANRFFFGLDPMVNYLDMAVRFGMSLCGLVFLLQNIKTAAETRTESLHVTSWAVGMTLTQFMHLWSFTKGL